MPAGTTPFTLETAITWVRGFGRLLRLNREYLTQLDAAIGDADHGINMERGFDAVLLKLDAGSPADLSTLFKLVGTTLVSTVGGASGPLYGTAFIRLGGALTPGMGVDAVTFGLGLAAAYDGVAARGRSAGGEKTLLDALGPALKAFTAAAEDGLGPGECAARARAAAEDGAKATIAMIAKKGRASFLGEKSAGHMDPGAASMALLFEALERATQ